MSKTYAITLTIEVPEEEGKPWKWDWADLLDLAEQHGGEVSYEEKD